MYLSTAVNKNKTKVALAVINNDFFRHFSYRHVEMSRLFHAHDIFRQSDTDFAHDNFDNFV